MRDASLVFVSAMSAGVLLVAVVVTWAWSAFPAFAQSPSPAMVMKKFDRNGDGRITRREWKGPGNAFKKFDQDGNKYLTRKELEARLGGGGNGDGKSRTTAAAPPTTQATPAKAMSEDIAAFSPIKAKLDVMQARGFVATGLTPVYPADADCPPGTSDFASRTRSDGSRRSRKFYKGFHGGYDIPAEEGRPVVAIADGTVVHKNEGLSIGGIGVILQHAPEDTDLGVWIYTEYKHLKEMPDLQLGQRLERGQQIGPSGKTGTIGGHYGSAGFAHLHLTA